MHRIIAQAAKHNRINDTIKTLAPAHCMQVKKLSFRTASRSTVLLSPGEKISTYAVAAFRATLLHRQYETGNLVRFFVDKLVSACGNSLFAAIVHGTTSSASQENPRIGAMT